MESLPRAYASTSALYYRGQPSLDDILGSTQEYADRLQEIAARLHRAYGGKAAEASERADTRVMAQRDKARKKRGEDSNFIKKKSGRESMWVRTDDGLIKELYFNSETGFSSPLLTICSPGNV